MINTTAGAGGTLNTGDSINGSAGNDTLDGIATAAATPIVLASMTGVETVKVQDLVGATVNLANATGVTKLVATNSTAQTTFNNVDAIAGVEVNGGAGMTVAYDAAVVAGLTDAQNVAVNGATGTVNAAGIETFNVAATGKNTLTLTNDGDTVNVSGTGSVTFGGAGLGITKLDASANTGGVTATLATGNVAVTGGAGNDSFSFGAGLTKADTGVPGDVVDGGAGTDTVRVTTGGNLCKRWPGVTL